MIYRATYVEKIMAYTNTSFIKILTGVRRYGKSIILKMIIDKLIKERNILPSQIISYHFDSMAYDEMTAKDIYTMIKNNLFSQGKIYLFLDEIQEIQDWEKVVNSLASDYDIDIYVTGSNSRIMSSEISTYLTGRYISFHIYALSFLEHLTFKEKYNSLDDINTE
ncbi:ATP-binding protein [Candidatus Stoquefichus massiliensis]|uniref:ATP-binding protein n=1 Tax=Candidatus Stoquefichus massiliensis TaxID=1470350 RepID=UPI0004B6E1AB|nr:AAA family ATPase [Candidatus Stoquefichus massiliensis]